jgi:SAM-dependent methyltransferase
LNYSVTAVDDLSDQWHLIGNNRQRIINFAKQFNIDLIVQSAEISQLKENYFDVVLLIDIVEHLQETPRELLNTAIAFLKINGLIIIEVPNTADLKNRISVLFGKSNQVNIRFIFWNIGKYRSHFREYTESELLEIMSYYKLKDINVKMLNLRTDMIYKSTTPIIKKIPILLYKIISEIYPNFRDTIIASGNKPQDWAPIQISINNFKKCYDLIDRYNLDNFPDDVLINQITKKEF